MENGQVLSHDQHDVGYRGLNSGAKCAGCSPPWIGFDPHRNSWCLNHFDGATATMAYPYGSASDFSDGREDPADQPAGDPDRDRQLDLH